MLPHCFTLVKNKRKPVDLDDDQLPASKKIKPSNPRVKTVVSNSRKVARRSVSNALRITRKAAVKPGSVAKEPTSFK